MVNMSLANSDPVSRELREVEKEIDSAYLDNPLTQHSLSYSAWHFLSFCEDAFYIELRKQETLSTYKYAALTDWIVNHAKSAMFWLRTSCSTGGRMPSSIDDKGYQAAWALSDLSDQYLGFETAYTYASRNMLKLDLTESTIVPSDTSLLDAPYEAYDRLVTTILEYPNIETDLLADIVRQSLRVSGRRFSYRLDPHTMGVAQQILCPLIDAQFTLPVDWQFEGYTMGQYRQLWLALSSIAYLHLTAHHMAADAGCIGLGYDCSLFVSDYQGLLNRLCRYSGLPRSVTHSILDSLTYGNQITRPDPVIQPIVPLGDDQYVISPVLVVSSSAERNLTVLLNQLSSQRSIYSRLVAQKESLMRDNIIQRIQCSYLRFWHGKVPGRQDLPDIDLAIVSDSEKACIIAELKWFIPPAEARELIQRSQEIKKGIDQTLKLSSAFEENPSLLCDLLGIGLEYEIVYIVISANSIGHGSVQDDCIPVINQDHLLRKYQSCASLRGIMDWLRNRDYLPREGIDYKIAPIISRLGRWALQWHIIEPLLTEDFI